mgnify:CR=1 FL=1
MIKKLPFSLVAFLMVLATYGQTIVSTTPENRKVVLEEFTGIHCVYCPSGHQIAQGIQDANPGNVFLINIHTGGYAIPGNGEPDFRTPYGAAIAGQTGLIGYPAGTINRQNFPGMEQGASGTTAMSRSRWTSAANQVLGDGSYVNLAVTADVNAATNVMNIHVEVYYTGNSPESTNFLNVAILQNNTLGPQTGGNSGNNYNHMHRLIDMVTGQWGEEISPTTSGTFIARDYAYPILAHNNFVPVELPDLEVVVFLSETHQKIPSGNGAFPSYTVVNNNDANLRYIEEIATDCLGEEITIAPRINIQNAGLDPITALTIDYDFNGTNHSYNWTGNIASLKSETIELPSVTGTIIETNTLDISLGNDDNNGNNEQTITFSKAPEGTGTVYMELHTDNYGNECRWNLKDSNGNILYNGGPYGNNQTINETFTLTEDCYSFNIIDTYGDGGGEVTLTDHLGTQLYHTDGNFGSGETAKFTSNGILGVNQHTLEDILVYPNPATSTINVNNAESANIEIYDVLGKMVLTQNNIALDAQIDISHIQSGAYFMKISKGNMVTTKKLLIAR